MVTLEYPSYRLTCHTRPHITIKHPLTNAGLKEESFDLLGNNSLAPHLVMPGRWDDTYSALKCHWMIGE